MIYAIPLCVPVFYIVATAIAVPAGMRPTRTLRIVSLMSMASMLVAFSAIAILATWGPGQWFLVDGNTAIIVRLDLVSVTMLSLIAFLGWIVTRFSATYLDGEPRQGQFSAWMSATLASVTLLVISGSLPLLLSSFVATSLCLHELLTFYRDRASARRAARKKFLFSRIADIALVGSVMIMGFGYGTADIGQILERAHDGEAPAGIEFAAALLAIAAMLKSAQFPTHGWLTEVMEAPTPVSALLHAGVVNAGGFLLIRFADVLLLSPLTLALLVMVGAFTALFGSVVMLTQSAVKTSLAWSTVAQMGFMIMQCGLALFPIALLHIVAHSLYKAHAFLSSGNAVEAVRLALKPGPVAIPSVGAVLKAFVLAVGIYLLAGLVFGFWEKPPQALALGAILIFGVAYLVAQGLAGAAPRPLTLRVSLYATMASIGYFGFQWIAYWLSEGHLPPSPLPGPLEWALIALAVVSFAIAAFAQSLFPLWAYHPATAGLRVHLNNGLYVNALIDKALGHHGPYPSKTKGTIK